MKRILEYEIYQSQRAYTLMESFTPQGNPRWPDNWKELDLWKDLEKMGFEDVTTPLQARNKTIMLTNKNFPHMYPAGVVLQASGYIRDKAARSGFIKSYKTAFTLNDLLQYVKDRWTKEYERMNPKDIGPLNPKQIQFINSCTSAPWKWNEKTKSVDVEGKVEIRDFDDLDMIGSFKFGKVKGDFTLFMDDVILDSIEDFAPDSVKSISIYTGKNYLGGIKTTKGFPQKIKEDATIYSKPLESLEDVPFDIKSLRTYYFDVSPYTVETALKVLEEGSVKTYYRVGGGIEIRPSGSPERGADEKARNLISTALPDSALDAYFKKNPLKLHFLDKYPDRKAGILKRTGIRDLSKLGKNLDTGWI